MGRHKVKAGGVDALRVRQDNGDARGGEIVLGGGCQVLPPSGLNCRVMSLTSMLAVGISAVWVMLTRI